MPPHIRAVPPPQRHHLRARPSIAGKKIKEMRRYTRALSSFFNKHGISWLVKGSRGNNQLTGADGTKLKSGKNEMRTKLKSGKNE